MNPNGPRGLARRQGSGGVLGEGLAPALEPAQLPLELVPRLGLDPLILLAAELPELVTVGLPRLTLSVVELAEPVGVIDDRGHAHDSFVASMLTMLPLPTV